MKNLILAFVITMSAASFAQLSYPNTPEIPVKETYFGKTYTDNYRWLEDMKAPQTLAWFKEQATLTDSIMDQISGRDELVAEWRDLRQTLPATYFAMIKRKDRTFFQKRNPDDKVSKVYYREGNSNDDQLLFDPMTFIPGKTLSVQSITPSYDAKKLLIAYSSDGAEVSTLRVLDVDKKTFLPDSIPNSAGEGGWNFDSKSFMYLWIRSADNNDITARLSPKTKLHVLGTPNESDVDLFSDESYPSLNIEEKSYPYIVLIEEKKDYVFGVESTVQNELKLYYAPNENFGSGKLNWKTLCTTDDELVGAPAIFGDSIYVKSHKNAPKFQLLSTSLKNPNWNTARVVIPENSKKLEETVQTDDYLLLTYSDGINSELIKFNPRTNSSEVVKLPFEGSVFVQSLDDKNNQVIILLTSWNKPIMEYLYDVETGAFSESPYGKPRIYPPKYLDMTVQEVEVKGHDGVMIPLSIIHKKGLKKDGSNVCLMEGYGSYGVSLSPYFDFRYMTLALKDVVIAIPHVRGGGEKGEAWYKAGYKTTKPNTWKDFISCAEYLIDQGYTKAEKLSGTGTSAGGILISRAITERPDLFAAAICNVGVANVMRGEFSSNGPVNVPEFGTVTDEIELKALFEMDGVQHVQKGVKYPAVMCVGGWNDPRVPVWQPAKFAAALQNNTASDKPVLMKVNYDNGHFTEDREVAYANFANQFAFAMWQCGHPDFQLKQ